MYGKDTVEGPPGPPSLGVENWNSAVYVPSIDWVTCTVREASRWGLGNDEGLRRWLYGFSEWKQGLIETPERISLLGYEGYQINSVKALWRYPDDAMLICSGALAADGWKQFRPEWDCTRLDIAVTFRTATSTHHLARAIAAHCPAARGEQTEGLRGRAPEMQLIQNSRRGDMLTMGRRSSPRYFRLYNKTAEGGDSRYDLPPDNCPWWRAELELKRPVSVQMFRSLYRTDMEPQALINAVISHWVRVGLGLFPGRESTTKLQVLTPSEVRPRANQDSRLRWLETSVRGAVRKLLADGVKPDEIIERLGLGLGEDDSTD